MKYDEIKENIERMGDEELEELEEKVSRIISKYDDDFKKSEKLWEEKISPILIDQNIRPFIFIMFIQGLGLDMINDAKLSRESGKGILKEILTEGMMG